MRVQRSGSFVLAAAMLISACAAPPPEPSVVLITVPTQPGPAGGVTACMDALASGTLVSDARWGIALGQLGAPTLQVIWPSGFVGRQVDGSIELLDKTGTVVGRVGQEVTVGGGIGVGNAWWACGAPQTQP